MEDSLSKYRQQVKISIRSVLVPEKDGLLLSPFVKEYLALNGQPINFRRLGYGCVLDLLRSLPEVVTVFDLATGDILLKGVPSKNSAHIAEFVRRQNKTQSGLNKETQRVLKAQSFELRREIQRSNLNTRSAPTSLRNEILFLMKENRGGLPIDDFPQAYYAKWGKVLEFDSLGFESVRDLLQSMRTIVDVRQVGSMVGTQFLVKPTEQYVRQWKEEDESNRRLRQHQTAPMDQRRSNPTASGEAFHTSSRTSPSRQQNRRVLHGDNVSSDLQEMISAKLKDDLVELIANFPEGLSIYELPKKFLALYREQLDYSKFGCTSMNEFCLLLPGIFSTSKPNIKSELFVFPAKKVKTTNGHECSSSFLERNSPEGQDSTDQSVTRRGDSPDLDATVYLNDEPIRVQKLPTDDSMFEVVMGEVFNPSKFYVLLRGKETTGALTDLVADMNKFYKSPEGNNLKMSAPSMLVSDYCVARWKGNWIRAVIRSLKDFDNVVLQYIDSGKVESVKVDDVRLLLRKFARLPAQGILARCSRIMPPNGIDSRWPHETAKKFLTLTTALHLPGLIADHVGTRIVQGETFVSLELIDTVSNDEPNGININDTLVELGLATLDPDAEVNDNLQEQSVADISYGPLRVPVSRVTTRKDPPKVASVSPTTRILSSSTSDSSESDSALSALLGAATSRLFQRPPPPLGVALFDRPPPPINTCKSTMRASDLLDDTQGICSTMSDSFLTTASHDSRSLSAVDEGRNLIQSANLDDGVNIHIFNIDDVSYVSSQEISNLFPKWKKRDLLSSMIELKLKKPKFPSLVITQSSDNVLFEHALCEAVPGFEDEHCQLVDAVTLYRLSDLPIMLRTLSVCPDEYLIRAAEHLIQRLDRSS